MACFIEKTPLNVNFDLKTLNILSKNNHVYMIAYGCNKENSRFRKGDKNYEKNDE